MSSSPLDHASSGRSAPVGCTPRGKVDSRGPRFAAAVTAVVVAAALVLVGTPVGTFFIILQTVAFALGAFLGMHAQPYGFFFARVIRPRLQPPAELEDAAPPRFSQVLGFAFLAVALVAALTGVTVVAVIALACAFVAAFLNAAFGFCLGCEVYLIGKRIASR